MSLFSVYYIKQGLIEGLLPGASHLIQLVNNITTLLIK